MREFNHGFEAGVCAEGGGVREHWSPSMLEAEQAALEEFITTQMPEGFAMPAEDAAPPDPDAPAADNLLDMNIRVANIIRKAYFVYTRNDKLAFETAMSVLEEVQRTYEQLALAAGLGVDNAS